MTKLNLQKLTADLKECREAALAAIAGMPDGGTCNFDAPTIYSLGVRKITPEITAAIKAAGVGYSIFKHHGLVLSIGVGGQGQTRTVGAETFHKALKARGYETSMYYQMD